MICVQTKKMKYNYIYTFNILEYFLLDTGLFIVMSFYIHVMTYSIIDDILISYGLHINIAYS